MTDLLSIGLLAAGFFVLMLTIAAIVRLARTRIPDNSIVRADPLYLGIPAYDRYVDFIRRIQRSLPFIERPVGVWIAAGLVGIALISLARGSAAAAVLGLVAGILAIQYTQVSFDRVWHTTRSIPAMIVPALLLLAGVGLSLTHVALYLYVTFRQ